MQLARLMIVGLFGAALGGCSMTSAGSLSALSGGFGDASSVSQTEAGTAIEVLLSGELGTPLEKSDRKHIATAQAEALKARTNGTLIPWQNEKTGHSGSVATGPFYQVNDQLCRELTYNMVVNSRPVSARGAACRAEGDSWTIIG